MIKQFIEIDTSFEALHKWPECPYEDVSFLRNLHRHMIYVKVRVETTTDREIEFFRFKMLVDSIIESLYGTDRIKDLGSESMEAIGLLLLKALRARGFDQSMTISVSEDNQVRSIIEWDPLLEQKSA